MTMRLFYWPGVLTDYSDGLCVGLGATPEEARAAIAAHWQPAMPEWMSQKARRAGGNPGGGQG